MKNHSYKRSHSRKSSDGTKTQTKQHEVHYGSRPVRIPIQNNKALIKYGYNAKGKDSTRHDALVKAVKNEGHITVIRRLIAISNLNENINPKDSRVFYQDAKWVEKKYKPKSKKTKSRPGSKRKRQSHKSRL